MITFIIALASLVLGYIFYGKFIQKIIQPDRAWRTPAYAKTDGVDFVPMPTWKNFMIEFLNIAGTGPIFGAIMGAKFGPVAYLWIIFGCIFAGAVHDYLSGMISMRNDGAGLPQIIGQFLGRNAKSVMLVFTAIMLVMVGVVFIYSPALILKEIAGTETLWIIVIFVYYIIATMLPIDKIIGKIYPLFAFALIFMAVALMVCLFVKWPVIPEIWDGIGNIGVEKGFTTSVFPALFITIACGAISGFHATQSPIVAKCLKNEINGKAVFYGSMITEGLVAVVWATVGIYFFYGDTPGYQVIAGAAESGYSTAAPTVVTLVCKDWLGIVGSVLALLGVVAAPISSGDTAFRSCRLIIAEALGLDQKPILKRIMISLPLFIVAFVMLMWQIKNEEGFNVVWNYFGWANQTLSVFSLWAFTVYLAREGKPYFITLIPALFMTTVCTTFLCVSEIAFGLPETVSYVIGGTVCVIAIVWFELWYRKNIRK